jgi:hypothetical protein
VTGAARTVLDVLAAAVLLTVLIRVVAALTEVRLRADGWPLWRCGPAALALAVHDGAVGLGVLGLLAGVPGWLLAGPFGADAGTARALTLALAAASVLLGSALLHRRTAFPLLVMLPGRLRRRIAPDPTATWRVQLLATVEIRAARSVAEWIDARLDRTRRRSGATDEQVLAALWSPARIRLRETVGVPRTEVALLLMQAQAVMDDGSPPQERLLTLLHLVFQRAGCAGVRSVLDQAGRAPLRHGRAAAATTSPGVA